MHNNFKSFFLWTLTSFSRIRLTKCFDFPRSKSSIIVLFPTITFIVLFLLRYFPLFIGKVYYWKGSHHKRKILASVIIFSLNENKGTSDDEDIKSVSSLLSLRHSSNEAKWSVCWIYKTFLPLALNFTKSILIPWFSTGRMDGLLLCENVIL